MALKIGVVFTALFCCCAAVSAEEEKDLPTVQVEARRASVIPLYFAGNATMIDEETIAEAGSRSVADLLAARGGIRISSTTGNASGGEIHLRGFGENSSSRVLLLIDGQPANRPDMAAVSMLEIPISRIERIEILKGSQTARFGDNAVGGVINFVTKRATAKPRGFFEVAAGEDEYFLVRSGFNGRFAGHGLSFDVERNFSDGWRENSASELESAAVRYDKELGEGSELRAGLAWSDEFAEFPGPLGKEEYESNPRQSIYASSGQGDQYFNQQSTWRADSTLLLEQGKAMRFEIPAAFSRREQEYNLGPGSHTDNLLDTYSVAPVVKFSGRNGSVEAGLSWRHDSLELQQYAEIQRRSQTAKSSLARDVVGIFSSLDWEISEQWHLNAGARAETSMVDAASRSRVSRNDPGLNFEREGNEWNQAFQLGLRWDGDLGFSSWLRYDRLYRLPSTDEIASYQGFPLSMPFNDRLHAEKGHNFELGGEYTRDEWKIRVNGFAQWLEGEIAYDYLENLNVNLADTRRVGVEAEVGYETKLWQANLHSTWLSAEFQDGLYAGNQVYLVPQFELGATIAWHPIERITIQAEYQFTGDSYEGNDFENNREKLPSYGVGNLLVRYEPMAGTSFYLRVNNLTDESYATVKYSGVWYPAAGRQLHIGVRCEF